jgi:hypothetical protein
MIDSFGDLKIDGERSKARLIQITPITYAAFPSDDPKTPTLITATGPAKVQGRNVTVEYRYADFPGLNLSREVLEAMAYHSKRRRKATFARAPRKSSLTASSTTRSASSPMSERTTSEVIVGASDRRRRLCCKSSGTAW